MPRARACAAHASSSKPPSRKSWSRMAKPPGVMTDKGPIRADNRRHLRRHVVARPGGADRRHPAAARRRAFLHRHRTGRRPAARPARALPRRRMDLLQGRRRQAARRLLRAQCQAVGPERHPRRFRLRHPARGHRPHRAAISRLPPVECRCCERTGIQLFFNGPESFTPDDRYLLGETPEVPGLFCATGFNSIGILSSGGVGKALADWIRDRRPPVELMDVDVRRMQTFQGNRRLSRRAHDRDAGPAVRHALALSRQFVTARGVRRSPFHDRLRALGRLDDRSRWLGTPRLLRRARHHARNRLFLWRAKAGSTPVGAECRNTAENVTLFDHSCFIEVPRSKGAMPWRC